MLSQYQAPFPIPGCVLHHYNSIFHYSPGAGYRWNPSRMRIKTPTSDSAALYLCPPRLDGRRKRFVVITASPCSLLKYQCTATPVCQNPQPNSSLMLNTGQAADFMICGHVIYEQTIGLVPLPTLSFQEIVQCLISSSIHLALLSMIGNTLILRVDGNKLSVY